MAELRAYAPRTVAEKLKKSCRGSVLLVTSKGIYLELEGWVLALCPEVWGTVPVGISIVEYDRILALKPEAGQRILCENGELRFPGGSVRLCTETVTEKSCGEVPVESAVRQTAEELLAGSGTTGLAPLAAPLLCNRKQPRENLHQTVALPALTAVREGLKEDDGHRTAAAALRLLGLGTGLTPSGDDVICGMLYVLLRSRWKRRKSVSALADAIKTEASERTNRISAAYLTAIARGEAYGRMEAVWRMLTGEASCPIRYLTEVGSNSGSEMLLGMLLAADLLCGGKEEVYG